MYVCEPIERYRKELISAGANTDLIHNVLKPSLCQPYVVELCQYAQLLLNTG